MLNHITTVPCREDTLQTRVRVGGTYRLLQALHRPSQCWSPAFQPAFLLLNERGQQTQLLLALQKRMPLICHFFFRTTCMNLDPAQGCALGLRRLHFDQKKDSIFFTSCYLINKSFSRPPIRMVKRSRPTLYSGRRKGVIPLLCLFIILGLVSRSLSVQMASATLFTVPCHSSSALKEQWLMFWARCGGLCCSIPWQ